MIYLSASILAAILKCCSVAHMLITIYDIVTQDDDFVKQNHPNLFIRVKKHIL